jgi:hypothetical protein
MYVVYHSHHCAKITVKLSAIRSQNLRKIDNFLAFNIGGTLIKYLKLDSPSRSTLSYKRRYFLPRKEDIFCLATKPFFLQGRDFFLVQKRFSSQQRRDFLPHRKIFFFLPRRPGRKHIFSSAEKRFFHLN